MNTSPHEQERQANAKDEESCMQANVTREWISLQEMQQILGIGSTKAYELAASGSIPGVIKIGRVIRINRSQLDGWLREQTISVERNN